MKILRESDVCPFHLGRDGLFEIIDHWLIEDGWGCHVCGVFFSRGETDYMENQATVDRAQGRYTGRFSTE
jgi:hypothetical protein